MPSQSQHNRMKMLKKVDMLSIEILYSFNFYVVVVPTVYTQRNVICTLYNKLNLLLSYLYEIAILINYNVILSVFLIKS